MDKTIDSMYGCVPPYMSSEMNMNFDASCYDNNIFNPVTQYEQAYMYYRYMTQQLDYKIKCKEYEQICGSNNNRKNNVS